MKKLLSFLLFINFLYAYDIKTLANKKEFKILFHYKKNSEIKDSNFFFTKKNFNLENELKYLIKNISKKNICKYPARYNFIAKYTNIKISFESCEKLNEFLDENQAQSISMIFASSFLNSPSSYFGHTFLKLNKEDNPYFSKTISYTAKITAYDTFFSTIKKGLGGGFNGEYLINSYYRLIEQYNKIEQRDLIEYKLNLNEDEIYLLLLHMYELKNINIEYDFFKENCAYQLLWLLKNARPKLNIMNEYKYIIVPFEIIELLQKEHLIINSKVRISKINSLYKIYKDLSPKAKKEFNKLIKTEDKLDYLKNSQISQKDKECMSYLLNGYYDILFKKYRYFKKDYDDIKKLIYIPRKELLDTNSFEPNKTQKIKLTYIKNKTQNSKAFTYRPMLFDRYENYNELSQKTLDIGSITFKTNKDNIILDKLNIINIESFSKEYPFYLANTWRFQFDLNREYENKLLANLEASYGKSYGIDTHLFYFMFGLSSKPNKKDISFDILYGYSYFYKDFILAFDLKKVIFDLENTIINEKEFLIRKKITKSLNLEYKYLTEKKEHNFSFSYFF